MKSVIFILSVFWLVSCSNGHEKGTELQGKDLNLTYEILSKTNLFPNDNAEMYFAHILLEIPKGNRYIDISESIKAIGLKENVCSARIFTSEVGYLMEIDSIPMKYSKYSESYFASYDLVLKGLNWKYQFKNTDIAFKGSMPIKIDVN